MEVEQFINFYNHIFNFQTAKPRDPDSADALEEISNPFSYTKATRNDDNEQNSSTHVQLEAPPSKQQRASILFGFDTQNQARIQQQLTQQTKSNAPTSHLQGLLGSVGNRFLNKNVDGETNRRSS